MNKRNNIRIRIEPTLFEFTGFYPNGQPKFATPQELCDASFNIDRNYVPVTTMDDVSDS